jgi:hypothetical protein
MGSAPAEAATITRSDLTAYIVLSRTAGNREENMAERVGFEPTIPVKVCPLSRRIVSTAHAPLRKTCCQLSVFSRQ